MKKNRCPRRILALLAALSLVLLPALAAAEFPAALLEDTMDVLRLVNRDNLLDKDYPDQSVEMYALEQVTLPVTKGTHKLRPVANAALTTLFDDAYAQGIELYVGSSHRTYRQQEVIHYNRVKRMGYDDGYSQLAGASEHQTGLAIDVVSEEYADLFQPSFGETREGLWLKEHCAEYGFILRYPEDKEAITGVRYEPWHLRYVGKAAAAYITDNGLTLEEFAGQRIMALGAYYGEAVPLGEAASAPSAAAQPRPYYRNPDGGRFLHADAACSAIAKKYHPLMTPVSIAELGQPQYRNMLLCAACCKDHSDAEAFFAGKDEIPGPFDVRALALERFDFYIACCQDALSVLIGEIGEPVAQYAQLVKDGQGYLPWGHPDETDIPREEAIAIAYAAAQTYLGVADQDLPYYYAEPWLDVSSDDYWKKTLGKTHDAHEWRVRLNRVVNPYPFYNGHGYYVYVHAKDGVVTRIGRY